MGIRFGDVQENVPVTLTTWTSESSRPNPHMPCGSFERSYNGGMRNHTLRGRLFATTLERIINNQLAVLRW